MMGDSSVGRGFGSRLPVMLLGALLLALPLQAQVTVELPDGEIPADGWMPVRLSASVESLDLVWSSRAGDEVDDSLRLVGVRGLPAECMADVYHSMTLYRLAVACPGGTNGLELQVAGVPGTELRLVPAECDIEEGAHQCSPVEGVVTVPPRPCALDVDGNGVAETATDVVYVARTMLGLQPVPSSFRAEDPNIPSDEEIAERVEALCPQQ